MATSTTTVRIKVTPQVVRIVGKEAPRDLQLSAARGALPLAAIELVTVLFYFCHGKDPELKTLARTTLHELPPTLLEPVVSDPETNPQLLHFIARERSADGRLVEAILINPTTGDNTFLLCAKKCSGTILNMIAENSQRIGAIPELVEAIITNPKADKALKFRLGWVDPEQYKEPEADTVQADKVQQATEEEQEEYGEIEEEDTAGLSKYQQALELGVAEKIKMALTGDKEWRGILLRDSNKLVSSAVLKNPRITDGEVLTLAKNRTTNDDMIRIILLNKDWIKSYEMKRALALHPRTPLPKALRFMSLFSDKDLKTVASSKDISAVLVNNARRLIMIKEQKKG